MHALFSWDSENKITLTSLTLFKGGCKMSYFLLETNCFTLPSLLCYFKVLCEDLILCYTVNFLKYKSFNIMFINNVKALLSIAYRISLQNHVRVLSMTKYRKPLFQNFQLSNFYHEEERAKELTLLASNRWRQWS